VAAEVKRRESRGRRGRGRRGRGRSGRGVGGETEHSSGDWRWESQCRRGGIQALDGWFVMKKVEFRMRLLTECLECGKLNV
jgi:hypothetical protein